MIQGVTYRKTLNIKDIEEGVLFLMAFSITPFTKETLMHKLARKNTGGLLYLLNVAKKSSI